MLESALNLNQTPEKPATAQKNARQRPVFRMGQNDRMAGSVPTWAPPESARDKVLSTVAAAGNTKSPEGVDKALAYATPGPHTRGGSNAHTYGEPFGFGDLLDMANPLQHIPIVSHLYRGVTGDEINPAAKLIGGAVYGGFFGGAAALADIIVEHEHGTDIAGIAKNMITGHKPGKKPPVPIVQSDNTAGAAALHHNSVLAAQQIASEEYATEKYASEEPAAGPASSENIENNVKKRAPTHRYSYQHQDERTAGYNRFSYGKPPSARTYDPAPAKNPAQAPESFKDKAPITKVTFSPMPPVSDGTKHNQNI